MYVTCEGIHITQTGTQEEVLLKSSQEEADTRMILHTKHAAPKFKSVILVADDTDILILSLAFSSEIACNIFMKCGTKTRTRYISITKLAQVLGLGVCKALVGLHAFTGCDTNSAFAGRGKLAGFKLLDYDKFQQTFSKLGKEFPLSTEVFTSLQEFTCQLYASRSPFTMKK